MNSSIALQSSKTQTGSRVGWGGPGGRAVGSVCGRRGGGSLGINLAWTQMIQRLFDAVSRLEEKSHLVGWLVGWLVGRLAGFISSASSQKFERRVKFCVCNRFPAYNNK